MSVRSNYDLCNTLHGSAADYSGDSFRHRMISKGTTNFALTAAGAAPHGVMLHNEGGLGFPIGFTPLVPGKYVQLRAGATIVAGAEIASDADGEAVTAVSTNVVSFLAHDGAAAGEIFTAFVVPQYTKA